MPERDRTNQTVSRDSDSDRPDLAAFECELGESAYEDNNAAEAERHFRRALEYDYDNARALRGLGFALQQLGNESEAVYFYLRYLEHDEDAPDVLQNVGAALHNSGDFKEALRYYDKAATLNPDDSVLAENQGRALAALGEIEPAISRFRQSVRSDPDNATAYIRLANLLHSEGKVDEALAALEGFEAAIERDAQNAYARLDATYFLEELDRFEPAIRHAEQAARTFEEIGDTSGLGLTYWSLGWLYYRVNKLDLAVEVSEKALEIDPSLLGPRFNKGLALLLQGRVPEARRAYEDGLALVSLASDLKSQAIEDLEEALQHSPDVPGGAEILRWLLEKYEEMRANRGLTSMA